MHQTVIEHEMTSTSVGVIRCQMAVERMAMILTIVGWPSDWM